jgi:hypothetical protein
MSITHQPSEINPASDAPSEGGWTYVDNRVVLEHGPRIGAIALGVYLAIAVHRDKSGDCYPSLNRLCALTGLCRNSVIKAIRVLELSGLIVAKRENGIRATYRCARRTGSTGEPVQDMHQTGSSGEPDRFTSCTGPVHLVNPNNNHEQEPSNKNHKQEPAGGRRGGRTVVSEPPIPESLDTPEFREAWDAFQQHRREMKKKLTPTAAKLQLQKLVTRGSDRASADIRYSISNGWQGIFEEGSNGNSSSKRHSRRGRGEYIPPVHGESAEY